jgi:hypothetical protein
LAFATHSAVNSPGNCRTGARSLAAGRSDRTFRKCNFLVTAIETQFRVQKRRRGAPPVCPGLPIGSNLWNSSCRQFVIPVFLRRP